MPTDNDFMKFMEKEYGVKFVDTKVEGGEKPKEPPRLPQAWVGMYEGRKRDAKYYEKCLKAMREGMQKALKMHPPSPEVVATENVTIEQINLILAHEYELDGVDLDKPNYGMF